MIPYEEWINAESVTGASKIQRNWRMLFTWRETKPVRANPTQAITIPSEIQSKPKEPIKAADGKPSRYGLLLILERQNKNSPVDEGPAEIISSLLLDQPIPIRWISSSAENLPEVPAWMVQLSGANVLGLSWNQTTYNFRPTGASFVHIDRSKSSHTTFDSSNHSLNHSENSIRKWVKASCKGDLLPSTAS